MSRLIGIVIFFGAEKGDKEVNAELFSAKNFALSFLCAEEPLEL